MLANSVDPDQTPRSAASDLGLHFLPRSPKRDAWLIWVNCKKIFNEMTILFADHDCPRRAFVRHARSTIMLRFF